MSSLPPSPPAKSNPTVQVNDRTGLGLVVRWEVDPSGDHLTLNIDLPRAHVTQ